MFAWSEIESVIIFQKKNLGDAALLIPVLESLLNENQCIRILVCTPAPTHAFLQLHKRVECFEPNLSLATFKKLKTYIDKPSVFLDYQPTLRFRLFGKLLGCSVVSGLVNAKKWLTIFDTYSPRKMPQSRLQSEMNLDVLRRLQIPARFSTVLFEKFVQSVPSSRKIRCLENQYLVVQLGSRWMFKTMRGRQWRDLILRLVSEFNIHIVLTGGDSEIELALASTLVDIPNVISLVGETDLCDLMALVRDAAGYIGVDTFASHLAALIGVPGVVIFGPTDPNVWGPHASSRLRVSRNSSDQFPCMPCNQDGCGGSKISLCLVESDVNRIVELFESSLNDSNSEKLG